MFLIVELLYGTQGKRERKREWQSINNIVMCNICEGGGYKGMYWKLLKNGGWEVMGEGGVMEGIDQTKVKGTHNRNALRNLFEHWLKY
jgi:hypothetical protein